jgi:hypothetical protein
VAAEDLAGTERMEALNVAAEQIMPGLIEELAWPTLRAHLLLLAGYGTDPDVQLATVAGSRELASADDRAAVLDWRLDDTGHRNTGQGPLPWLPGIPPGLGDHPVWRNYLAARSDLVRTLADQVGATITDNDQPAWVTQCGTVLPSSVVADVQVWRAAMQVSPEDRRPTGPVQLQKAARTWQQHLDRQVAGDRSPALQEWGWQLNQLSPNLTTDPFATMLADRLAAISRAGADASQLLRFPRLLGVGRAEKRDLRPGLVDVPLQLDERGQARLELVVFAGGQLLVQLPHALAGRGPEQPRAALHAFFISPMIVPVMQVDLFELANNHHWRTEYAITNWAEPAPKWMGFGGSGTDNERDWTLYGFQTYYALLNCGFRLCPSAGTDCFLNRITSQLPGVDHHSFSL